MIASKGCCEALLFSRSVVSNFLQPHRLQHSKLPVLHYLPEFAQTHVHWVSDAIQPSHPLSPPSPLALNISQHQGLFQWVGFLNQVAKVLELQPQILHSLEGLMLKLKLQYFGYLIQRINTLEKTLMLRNIEGRKRRGQQSMRWLDGFTTSMDMSLSQLLANEQWIILKEIKKTIPFTIASKIMKYLGINLTKEGKVYT